MKTTFKVLFFFSMISVLSQAQSVPVYSPSSLEIKVPVEMQSAFADTLNRIGDFYQYNVEGMSFQENEVYLPILSNGFGGNANPGNPFGVIANFWYAYQSGNVDMLRTLIDEGSLDQLEESGYFRSVRRNSNEVARIDTIQLLGATEFDGGVMVYTYATEHGIERNYLRKKGNRYYITPMQNVDYHLFVRNFIVYLYFNPVPYRKPPNVSFPDSVEFKERVSLTASVSQPGRYIIFASGPPANAVFACVADNAVTDGNNQPREIEFTRNLSFLLPKGENEVYVVESNFPVMFTTQNLINNAVRVNIVVK